MPAKPHGLSAKLTQEAVAVLRRGGLVAFPTETVYGLGADASNRAAVARIFEVKGRPSTHPLIVHIGNTGQLERWAREIPDAARKLASRFWPGPLTLVLRRVPGMGDAVAGGQDTIGLRIPGHPVALKLLRQFQGGIAAPSANRFGRISPTRAEHVRDDLGNAVDLILDGGPCEIGIESTIVDLSRGTPVVLRPGQIDLDDIAATVGVLPRQADQDAPRAPGTLRSHYAPYRPLRLIPSADWERCLRLGASNSAVLSFRPPPPGDNRPMWIRVTGTAAGDYAHALYANLRALDSSGCDEILVEAPPQTAEWAAVMDRLARAQSA